MATRAINVLGLCAGIGGLEVGVRLAIPGSRTVCYVEREAFAAAALVARMETQDLDPAPVWDDLCTFDGRPWRGVVDLIAAGFPCQPASCAGRRRGTSDDRWLWPHVARIVGEVRPALVVLENVRGLLSVNAGAAFKSILRDFSSMGFAAEWGVVRASDAGAPHQRARVFVLAHQPGRGRGILRDACRAWDGGHAAVGNEGVADSHRRGRTPVEPPGGGPGETECAVVPGEELADAEHTEQRWQDDIDRGLLPKRPQGTGGSVRGVTSVADARSERLQGDGEARPAEGATGRGRGAAVPVFPPGPSDADAWASILAARPDLAPAVANTQADRQPLRDSVSIGGSPTQPDACRRCDDMADTDHGGCLRRGEQDSARIESPPGNVADRSGDAGGLQDSGRRATDEAQAQPEVRRVDDGAASGLVRDSASRIDQLRALGNAVVPAQAALALRVLVERLLKEET